MKKDSITQSQPTDQSYPAEQVSSHTPAWRLICAGEIYGKLIHPELNLGNRAIGHAASAVWYAFTVTLS